MVSQEFQDRFTQARAVAQGTGKPLIDILAKEDMLLTPERKREIVLQFMDFMITTLEEHETPEAVLRAHHGSRPGTPTDMYFAMVAWLYDWKKVELE